MPLATSGSSYKDVLELWMKRAHWKLGGGFNCFFMFTPILEKMSNLAHIFQTG